MLKTGTTVLALGQDEELCAVEVNEGLDMEGGRCFEAIAN